jgi:radical SAM protein with 4Fe4S-binding SPASM domain
MPCEHLDYGQFSGLLDQNLGGRRAPLSVTIGLTDRCNLRCVHCFVHDPAKDREARSRELTTAQWYGIFDQLADAGCFWMTWTGGEILLRADFADLYRYAKRKGFLLSLLTNGTLLTREVVDLLGEWCPLLVEISLYGLTRETYERVTGVPGAYDQIMRGIDLLQEAGVPLRLKTIAMTLTQHEVPAMYEFAAALGVQFRHDGVLFQTYHGRDISDLRLPPAELVQLDDVHPRAAEDFLRLNERHQGSLQENPAYAREHVYICGAGFRSSYVDPYGWLGLCQMTRPAVYDLASGAFDEGWKLLGRRRRTKVTKDYECLHCNLAGFCQRCPAFSMLEHDDAESVVEYPCAITHLRAERLGIEAPSELHREPMS